MFTKAKLNNLLTQMREFASRVDSTKEVRESVEYNTLIVLHDRLKEAGVPGDVAAIAAAQVNINLPAEIAEFPKEYEELLRLVAISMSTLYQTLTEDFNPDIVNDLFLAMVSKHKMEVSL